MPSDQIIKARKRAFHRQHGHCFYCDRPMWLKAPEQFAFQHRLTPKQTMQLRCTAEHLLARKDGGSNHQSNIAAACLYCNRHRHGGRINELSPERYRSHVRRRLQRGAWHTLNKV